VVQKIVIYKEILNNPDKFCGCCEKFSQSGIKLGFWELDWSGGGKLEGQNYRFEIGASKLLNNLITSVSFLLI